MLSFSAFCATALLLFSGVDGEERKADEALNLEEQIGEGGCDFYPEVVLVQDVSTSFEKNMENMAEFVPKIFEFFEKRFQNKAKFGLTTFTDKTAAFFGKQGDVCCEVKTPLFEVSDKEKSKKLAETFANLYVGGGLDYFEGANSGMFRAALSSQPGWSELTHDPETGRPIVRIMIIVTDAPPHEAGVWNDIAVKNGSLSAPLIENNLMDFPTELNDSCNWHCSAVDYPTGAQIKEAFAKRNIIPIMFAGLGTYLAEDPYDHKVYPWFYDQYEDYILAKHKDHPEFADYDNAISNYYRWYFKEYVGVDAVVSQLTRDQDNFVEQLEKAMASVGDLYCLDQATTTLAPVPTTVATVKPTTPIVPTTAAAAKPTTTLPTVKPTTAAPKPTTEAVKPTTVATVKSTTPAPPPATTAAAVIPVPPVTVKPDGSSQASQASAESEATEQSDPTQGPSPTRAGESSSSSSGQESEAATEGGRSDSSQAESSSSEAAATEEEKKGSPAVIIGAASGGAAAAAAAGLVVAKKLGLLFNHSGTPDMNTTQDVDNVEITEDREQFEAVTGDLFA